MLVVRHSWPAHPRVRRRPAMSELRMLSLAAAIVALVRITQSSSAFTWNDTRTGYTVGAGWESESLPRLEVEGRVPLDGISASTPRPSVWALNALDPAALPRRRAA